MAYPSPRQLQLRRGNTTAVSTYLGLAGEITINTDDWTIRVYDGVTVGGHLATVNTATIIDSITGGNVEFGNLVPKANVAYSLGTLTHQWKDLFVSNNTIYMGGVPLTITNGNLTVGNNTIVNAAAYTETMGYTNYSNVNLASYLGGSVTIGGNLTVTGNLFLNGNTTLVSTNNLIINDNIIYIANANPGSSLDIGLVGHFTSTTYQHTGLVRQASTNQWQLFSNVVAEPGATIDFTNAIYDNIRVGNITSPTITGINANVTAANVGIKGYIDLANTIQSAQLTAANVAWQANSYQQQALIGNLQASAYSNVNVAAYLSTQGIGGGNYSNVNVAAYLTTNSYLTSNLANLTNYAYASNVTTANTGMKGYVDQGNTIQASAITAANVGMLGYVNSQTFYSNARVATYLQAGNISNVSVAGNVTAAYFVGNGALLTGIVAGGGSYSNVDVANYLPTYTGNLAAANLLLSSRTINSTSTTVDLFNATTLNINAFGAATDISIGVNNAAARFGIKTPNIWFENLANLETYSSSIKVFNTTATTVNAFGAASTIVFGANTSTATFRGNVTANNVAVTALTASQAVFTDANDNLVSRAVTGTGNVVLSDGPVLTGTVILPLSQFGLTYTQIGATDGTNNNGVQIGSGSLNSFTTIGIGANSGESDFGTVTNINGTVNFTDTGGSVTFFGATFNAALVVPGSLSVSGTMTLGGSATAAQTFATDQTTGTLTIGGLLASGNITLGRSTRTQTVNIGNGIVASGNIKTITIGTGGAVGSNTNIVIGPTLGVGNVFFNNNTAVTMANSLSVTGNITTSYFIGNLTNASGNIYAVGNIIVGVTGYTVLPTTVAQFTGNANTYTQLNIQNISTGLDATSEYVATANNGTDTTFFVDMGIANSNYDVNSPLNSLGTTIYPNDSYLYAQGNLATTTGGNLAIGTSTANKSVKIFAGGINSANIVATISNTGLAVTGNITATGTGNFAGNVTVGNLSVTGNLSANLLSITANSITGTGANTTIVAGAYTSTFDNAGNVSMPNVIVSGTVYATNFVGNITSGSTGNLNVVGNLISTGYGFFPGRYNESATTSGVFIGNTGTGTPSPRIGFFNGNTTQNWQIDNYFGTFRWFTPGVTQMTLDSTGSLTATNITVTTLTATGNANVAGTGGISIPNRPAFRVIGQGGSITVGGNLIASNWTVDYTQGNSAAYLNGTNGTFTAPVAGLYSTTLTARTTSNTNGSIIQAVIQQIKAGSTSVAMMIEWGANTTFNHASGSTTVKLAAGDKLYVTCLASGAPNGTGFSFDGNDHWDVTYLG